MNHFKQFFICFFSLLFLLPLLQGCSNSEEIEGRSLQEIPSQKNPVYGGTYRIPLKNNPITLDPALTVDRYGVPIVEQIFDGLVRFDTHLSVVPALAETWEVTEKGKVYRFKLKDAVFHNQALVTSNDVKFSIQRLLRMEPPSAVLQHLLKIKGADAYRMETSEHLTGITIEDDKRFSIRLKQTYIPFLAALGMYQVAIVPEKTVLELGDGFGSSPVGTGPFRFLSWEKNRSIRLHRFKDYYDGPAFLDGIFYPIYSSEQNQTLLNDFKLKRLDEMTVGKNAESLAELEGLQWFQRPLLSLFFYGINTIHPHLADPGLRKAMSAAIDRKRLVNTVYDGQFQVTRTILPPGMAGYHRLTETGPDLQLSGPYSGALKPDQKELELEIVSASKGSWDEAEMAIIQEAWSPLGIRVRPKYITDWKAFNAYLKSGSAQIYRYVWHADLPDPDSFLSSLFSSDAAHNFMGFKNRDIDSGLRAAREIIDPVKRARQYQRIESKILSAAPVIPLFYLNVNRVYQPHVQSIRLSPLGAQTTLLNRVWLDKNLNK